MPVKKSSEIKKSEGNRSKDSSLNNEENQDAKVPLALPPAPAYLCPVAKKEWNERGRELLAAGLMSSVDVAAFAFYCDSFAKWQELNKELKKKDQRIVQERKKTQVQRVNLFSTQAEKYKDSCLKFLREFGMTPKARVGLSADLGAVRELDPYEEHQKRMAAIKKVK